MSKQIKKPKPQHRRRELKGAPKKFYRIVDLKGEAFDDHRTRSDAYYDTVGPRFYRGYYIVEYVLRSVKRYKYQATHREVTGVHD